MLWSCVLTLFFFFSPTPAISFHRHSVLRASLFCTCSFVFWALVRKEKFWSRELGTSNPKNLSPHLFVLSPCLQNGASRSVWTFISSFLEECHVFCSSIGFVSREERVFIRKNLVIFLKLYLFLTAPSRHLFALSVFTDDLVEPAADGKISKVQVTRKVCQVQSSLYFVPSVVLLFPVWACYRMAMLCVVLCFGCRSCSGR